MQAPVSELSASERQRIQRRNALRTGWTLAAVAVMVFAFYIFQVSRTVA
jgi:hypothetical protein